MFSSRVEKSSNEFKPTIKRRRKIEKPQETIKEVPVVEEEIIVAPEPQLRIEPIKPVEKVKSAQIEPLIAETGSRMMDLIKQKFPEGRLSQWELKRRQDVKQKKPAEKKVASSPKPVQKQRTAQLITVNGEIVVDKDSLVVQQESIDEDLELVEEDAQGRYITSASFRSKKKLVTPKWHQAMTDRFFLGLSYFGTNFKMISYMFPGLLQKHIKAKFKMEERKNPLKVTDSLKSRKKAPEELRLKMLASVGSKNEQEDGIYYKNANKDKRDDGPVDVSNMNFNVDETKSQIEEQVNMQVNEESERDEEVVEQVVEKETPKKAKEVELPTIVQSQISGVKAKVVRRRKQQ